MSKHDFLIKDGVLFKYGGKGGDVIIPEDVESIGECAFKECTDLKSVTFSPRLPE